VSAKNVVTPLAASGFTFTNTVSLKGGLLSEHN
jgi:hypothetical protein